MLKAISLKPPWTWLMLHGGKDIENRQQATNWRGPVFIHASLNWDDDNFPRSKDKQTFSLHLVEKSLPIPPDMPLRVDAYPKGGIVGIMTITGCYIDHKSPWFFGKYGYTIKNAYPLPFTPMKGALGLWEVDPEKVRHLEHYIKQGAAGV